ncbi:DUF6531 domain-containing protein [Ureibacillus sp. 179-F W5.1 NHS]|uniref:DUF6531 domain-containing protein n=1 Tax=unclassified Ureibacillus TaxID=2638520 RepID=UPI0031192190
MFPTKEKNDSRNSNELFTNPNSLLDLVSEQNTTNDTMANTLTSATSNQTIGNNSEANSVTQGLPNLVSGNLTENSNLNPSQPRAISEEPISAETKEEPPVNVENGYLELEEVDINVPQVTLSLNLTRNYSSNDSELGYFGKGWNIQLDSRLQMYTEFSIGESRLDGSTQSYEFIKDDPEAYITEYDNDKMTNYELDKGHYETTENGDTLTSNTCSKQRSIYVRCSRQSIKYEK